MSNYKLKRFSSSSKEDLKKRNEILKHNLLISEKELEESKKLEDSWKPTLSKHQKKWEDYDKKVSEALKDSEATLSDKVKGLKDAGRSLKGGLGYALSSKRVKNSGKEFKEDKSSLKDRLKDVKSTIKDLPEYYRAGRDGAKSERVLKIAEKFRPTLSDEEKEYNRLQEKIQKKYKGQYKSFN